MMVMDENYETPTSLFANVVLINNGSGDWRHQVIMRTDIHYTQYGPRKLGPKASFTSSDLNDDVMQGIRRTTTPLSS